GFCIKNIQYTHSLCCQIHTLLATQSEIEYGWLALSPDRRWRQPCILSEQKPETLLLLLLTPVTNGDALNFSFLYCENLD
ncbi:hypothetical protein, partial [Yersinia pestis]|uniref:hypothetical protein n=1 Tax=Yersinia pestis TaxID=632 RepID=UPI000578029E